MAIFFNEPQSTTAICIPTKGTIISPSWRAIFQATPAIFFITGLSVCITKQTTFFLTRSTGTWNSSYSSAISAFPTNLRSCTSLPCSQQNRSQEGNFYYFAKYLIKKKNYYFSLDIPLFNMNFFKYDNTQICWVNLNIINASY